MARSLKHGRDRAQSRSPRRRPAATPCRPSCVRRSPSARSATAGARSARERGRGGGGDEVRLPRLADRRRAGRRGRAGGADFREAGCARAGSVVVVSGGNVDPTLYAGDIARRLSVRRRPGRPAGSAGPSAALSGAALRHRASASTPGRASAALSITPSSSRDKFGRIALSIESSACSNPRWSWKLMAPLLCRARLSLCERRAPWHHRPHDRFPAP